MLKIIVLKNEKNSVLKMKKQYVKNEKNCMLKIIVLQK